MPSMTFLYNIDTNDNNKHHYKSQDITFIVTNYEPIKLIISKYSPYITFMMHKCTIMETSLQHDSILTNQACNQLIHSISIK